MRGADVERFMREALAQGRNALPACAPNPPVGCVIVRDGAVVARGHTDAPGSDHAEAMALRTLQGDLRGCVVFVTLEPCSFHGRTPSCARALVSHEVEAIHIATLDPDPRNQGLGVAILRAAGARITVGTLEAAALEDLAPYLHRAGGARPTPGPE